MVRVWILLIAIPCVTLPIMASVDSTQIDSVSAAAPVKRRVNGELLFGAQQGIYVRENLYNGEVIPGQSWTHTYTYVGLGYGLHIPLWSVGELSTIWLVPAVSAWLSFGDEHYVDEWGYEKTEPAVGFDVSVPVHMTYGYGGLRRSASKWGIEGGLGVNMGLRARSMWETNFFTITPSALVDVTFAPRNVYRLRFMVDILPYQLSHESTYQESYRTWTAQFVLGI